MPIPCLFLSYRWLLLALRSGEVTKADLEGGLYYLGCARKAISDSKEYKASRARLFPDEGARNALHQMVMDAIDAADKAGRVAWRVEDGVYGHRTYEALNVLLARNGFGRVAPDASSGSGGFIYYNHDVRKQIEAAGLNLRVIPTR